MPPDPAVKDRHLRMKKSRRKGLTLELADMIREVQAAYFCFFKIFRVSKCHCGKPKNGKLAYLHRFIQLLFFTTVF